MAKTKTEGLLPLRPCAGALVFNAQGLVWVGRRCGSEELRGSDFLWQLPQGGIDKGEDPEAAARRELYEETSIRSVTLIRTAPDWFDYELPAELVGKALKGRYRGQTQRWSAYRFTGPETEIDVLSPPDGNTAEFDAWRWERLERVPDLVVPFKRPVYDALVAAFCDLSAG